VTVESQICGALNGFINDLHLPCQRVKKVLFKQSESDLHIFWTCYNIHLMLSAN